jgi:hypothetical protein
MRTSLMVPIKHLDAPFWAIVVLGLLSIGSVVFFGLAASEPARADATIMETDHVPPPRDLL